MGERGLEAAAAAGREADAEARDGRGVDAALGEIVARGGAIDALQLLGEPFLHRAHDVGQAGGALGLVAGARVGGGDLHPGLGGELLDRVHERHAARVGQEADRVAMRAAAEAMVEALVVVDREAGGFFLVERAAGLELAARP